MTAGHDTAIIASLQEEIAAAEKKLHDLVSQRTYSYGEEKQLTGYIEGLTQALVLLTRQPVRELEF